MLETKYLKEDVRNIQKLLAIPIFKHFEIENLGGLVKRSKIREYADNEQIIKEGDNDPWFYFLLSGKVAIMKKGEIISTLQRSGDVFGEMSLIDNSKRSASAYAIGKTICLATDTVRIKEISGDDWIIFGYILYRIFAMTITERLRSTTDQLVKAKEQLEDIKHKNNPSCSP